MSSDYWIVVDATNKSYLLFSIDIYDPLAEILFFINIRMLCKAVSVLLLSIATVQAVSIFSQKELPPFESLNQNSEKVYNNLIFSLQAKRIYMASKDLGMTLEKSGLSKKEYNEAMEKGATEDPQRHLNELATLYQVLNIGDMVMLDKINDLCSPNPNEGLLRTQNSKNKPLCFEDPVKLIKMIESRIRAVTSHVLLDPLLSFPEGWYDHVIEANKILKKLKVEPENMELTLILIDHALNKEKQNQVSESDSANSTLKPKNALSEVMESGTVLGVLNPQTGQSSSAPASGQTGSVEPPNLTVSSSAANAAAIQPDVQQLALQIAQQIMQQKAAQNGQTLQSTAQQPLQQTAQPVQNTIQQPTQATPIVSPSQNQDCGHRIIIDARPTQPDSLTSNIMPGLLNSMLTNV